MSNDLLNDLLNGTVDFFDDQPVIETLSHPSPDPIQRLYQRFAQTQDLFATLTPPTQPITHHTTISQSVEQPPTACSRSLSFGQTTASATAPGTSFEPSAVDSIVGSHLLETLSKSPLSPASRVEAIRRLAIAMANPSKENLEPLFMILITNDPIYGQ